jgi:hypothetical protein
MALEAWRPEVETYAEYLDRTWSTPVGPGEDWWNAGKPATPLASAPVAPPADLAPPPPAATTVPQAAATPEAVNPEDTSGKDLFTQSLISQGFSPADAASLTNQLWTTSKTKTGTELWIDLRKTPEYATRFGGLVKLRERAAGGEYIPYIPSEGEYVTSEKGYAKVARDAGLPPGFYDEPSDFANLIGGGVSVSEYADRVQKGTQAALGTDPALRDELALYGADLGNLTAFFLDPDKGTEVLNNQWTQAQIGAASRRSGFGVLTQGQKETLQGRGLTEGTATAGMAAVAQGSALEAETAGETMAGEDLTKDQQLGLATGEGADTAAFERRRRARQAAFGGGGGAAQGGAGTSGLGSAR